MKIRRMIALVAVPLSVALFVATSPGCNDNNSGTQAPGAVPTGGMPGGTPGMPGGGGTGGGGGGSCSGGSCGSCLGGSCGGSWGCYGGNCGSLPGYCGSRDSWRCGWTPGWHCGPDSFGHSECCWDAQDFTYCGGGNGGSGGCWGGNCGSLPGYCGSRDNWRCGWTPGWHCGPDSFGSSECCWDAHDYQNCPGTQHPLYDTE